MCVVIALDMAIAIPPANLRRNEQPFIRRLSPEEMTASMALLGSLQLPYCSPEDRIRQLYSQKPHQFEMGTFAKCNDHLPDPNFVMHTSTASEIACAQSLHIPITQPLCSPPQYLSSFESQLSGEEEREVLQSPDLYVAEVKLESTEMFLPVPTVETPLQNNHDAHNTQITNYASAIHDSYFRLQTLPPNGLDRSSHMYHNNPTAPHVLDYDSRGSLPSGIEANTTYPKQDSYAYGECVDAMHGQYGGGDELPRDYSAAEASIRQMPSWLARYKQQRISTWQQGVRPLHTANHDSHWSYRHRNRGTRGKRREHDTRAVREDVVSSIFHGGRERGASV
jgi:hypothetical protein